MERLSSGVRVNSAADDAAGLSVANKMSSQLRGINMAVRNSMDGVSLVQTADYAINEISNMTIRMRELAVQMNNGVYTQTDRENAQLEVEALKAEIEKICSNTAFNEVKLLNGTYDTYVRAGNTNAEIVDIQIDGACINKLGGGVVTRDRSDFLQKDTETTRTRSVIEVTESNTVTIANSELGVGMLGAPTGGLYTIRGVDAGEFTIDVNTGAIAANGIMDYENPTGGPTGSSTSYQFEVVYTASGKEYVDEITLNLLDAGVEASTSGSVNISLSESDNVTINDLGNRVFSENFESYVNNEGLRGTFTLTGVDANEFTVDSSGVITAVGGLDFENPAGGVNGNANTYEFTLRYQSSSGEVYSEDITLNVLDIVEFAPSITPGYNPVRVELSVNTGSLILGETAGLEAPTGFSSADWAGASTVVFEGSLTDVNAALASVTGLTDGATLSARITPVGWVYNPTTTHYYKVFTDVPLNWSDASTAALAEIYNGQAGYLATITSAVENSFIETYLLPNTISGPWIGASDAATEDAWLWVTGPEAGTNFFNGRKNNHNAVSGQYHNMHWSQPGWPPETQDYLLMMMNGFWGDDIGTKLNPYLVEHPNVATSQTFLYSAPTPSSFTVNAVSSSSSGRRVSSEIVQSEHDWTINESRKLIIDGGPTVNIAAAASMPEREALATFMTNHPGGDFTLTGADASFFKLDENGVITSTGNIDYEKKSSFDFTSTYTSNGQVFIETYNLIVPDDPVDNTSHVEDVDISSAATAADAVLILDKAIDQLSSSRAKLGAIQNRLSHNIDNLTRASMLTESSRGRVIDADFARETSLLSKFTILNQASTAMLSQANMNKRNVLTLING